MRLPALVVLLSANLAAQAAWTQLYPAVAPTYRQDAACAFHEPSGAMIVFSGSGPAGLVNDAWRLQGNVWSVLAGPLPPARRSAAMVYDSARQRLVLFGGSGNSGFLQDTWEWNGTTWTTAALANQPSPRDRHAMAFDPQRGVTVLFGGITNNSTILGDLWEWNGTSWTQRAQVGGPGPRVGAVLAFDPVRGDMLLFGGSKPFGSSGGTVAANDTWSWNGSVWQQQQPATPPTFRAGAAAVTDVHRRRVVLQGGTLYDPFAWEWNGTQWQMMVMASPSPRSGHAMAYDTLLRRTLLFGGSDFWIDDTWKYETPSPASVTAFGSACAGSAGTPQLAAAPYELPWLGDTIHHRVTNVPPTEAGAVFLTGFTPVAPASLAPIGMVGCTLLVSIDWATFSPNVAGVAEWTLAVPVSASLVGVSIQQQAFPFDAAANPFGLSASNALTATFGVR